MTAKTDTSKKPRSRRIWRLVTNHQNMLYMLAAGMVMSPAGFRGKHYSDPLSVWPGWIPLFRNQIRVPADALHHATRERKHLLPCIASFDLSALSGPVQILSRDGSVRDAVSTASGKRKDDIAILVRAPLPSTLIFCISFCSLEDRKAFESAANDVSNVDLSSCRIEVAESMFSTDTEVAWPARQMQEPLVKDDGSNYFPAFGQALGGALAMLYHIANRSGPGLAAFRLVSGAARDRDSDLLQSDPVLAGLPGWIDGDEIAGQVDTRARLFWEIIQSLVNAQMQERPQAPVDVALACLENELARLPETEPLRSRLERLIVDMRSSTGLGGGTITELFERRQGSLSRSLLLFCLREHCAELLEFSHPSLKDIEYLLAGILFGVRDGWLQLPGALRNADMSAWVVCRMADAERSKRGDSLALDILPSRPQPLRELFAAPGGEWNSVQRDVAMELVSECGWNDCIRTRIIPAEGDFPPSFERNGSQVVFPGRVTVTEEVDKAAFLHRLGQWPPIARQLECEMREKLSSVQEIGEMANGNSPSCA